MISSSEILKANILIVDDQQANITLLEHILRGAGYTSFVSTTDPREVCELHRKNRYDLILLDLKMPGMDGFEVMECLKAIEPDGYLPVLVITAQPEHKLRALKAGARDFVSKPFDLAEVRARVNNMLEVRLLQTAERKRAEEHFGDQPVGEKAASTGDAVVVTDSHGHQIGKRSEVEHEIHKAKIDPESAHHDKGGASVASMCREIGVPVTAIMEVAEQLLEPGQKEAMRIECAEAIRHNGAKLLELIDGFRGAAALHPAATCGSTSG